MRILIVSHEYPPLRGGAGVGVRHLAEALVELGHRVEVIAAGASAGVTEENGVVVRRLSCGAREGQLANLRMWLGYLVQAPPAVRESLADLRPQVVVSFFPVIAGYAVARARCPVPHVTCFVGADIHDPTRLVAADRNPVARLLTGRALRHAAAVTAISRDMVRRIEAVFPGRPVHKISLGVPALAGAPPQRRPGVGSSEGGLLVATACRLVRRKRIDLLLDAIAELDDPRVRAVVIGAGPLGPSLRRHAARLGIADRVRFAGWVDEAEKASLLASADVFCLPSEHEAFGLAIVEAMGLATAVVTTRPGGQADIVRDGIDGFLVPVGDAHLLAERLRALLLDPTLLTSMQRAAADRARSFSPEQTARGFLDLFQQLL